VPTDPADREGNIEITKLPSWLQKMADLNPGLVGQCEFEYLVGENEEPLSDKKHFVRAFICSRNGVSLCEGIQDVDVVQVDGGYIDPQEGGNGSMVLLLVVIKTGE